MQRLRRQRGVTLMELLISLVVIVIGMLVIFRVLSTGVQGGLTSSHVAQAQQRASAIVEAIRLAPYAAIVCLEGTPANNWSNCEDTCKANQTHVGGGDPSSCIFSISPTDQLHGFGVLSGPLYAPNGPPTQRNQAADRQGQNYFVAGGSATVSITGSYGKSYVFMGSLGLRTAEIGVTIGWNDDNTTFATPQGTTIYPQHTYTIITGMPQPAGP